MSNQSLVTLLRLLLLPPVEPALDGEDDRFEMVAYSDLTESRKLLEDSLLFLLSVRKCNQYVTILDISVARVATSNSTALFLERDYCE